jgi:RHS repeat-associated protein
MVYDKLDRPVLSQDAHQTTLNKWNFTKYDVHNRTAFTGEITNPLTQTALQSAFNTHPTPNEVWMGVSGYSGTSYPSTVPVSDVRQYMFYDNYDFRDALAPSFTFNSLNAYHSQYLNPKGLLTGTIRYQIPTNGLYLMDAVFYDSKNRAIQTIATHINSTNSMGEPIFRNFQYNFSGEVLKQKLNYNLNGKPITEFITENILDHLGRPLSVKHSINLVASELFKINYDMVGRILQKRILPNGVFNMGATADYIYRPPSPILGTTDIAKKAINLNPGTIINSNYLGIINPNASTGTPIKGLQTMDYFWHIRGGLRGINLDKDYNTIPNTADGDLFSYKLDYETAGFWDGNIGKQSWANLTITNTTENRSYTFSYDKSSRLKSGIYSGLGVENYSIPLINYDRNGNISKLQRNGKMGSTFGLMDNMTYAYMGNILSTVIDAVTSNNNIDFVPRGNNSYSYWPNGSLKSDANKEITSITYDTYLKKPIQIDLIGGRWIKICYDGAGKVLKRKFSTGEYWEYIDGLILKNNMFYSHASPEGRAIFTNNSWSYEFYYTDHLGNARVTFAAENNNLVTKDISHFDPTNLPLNGINQDNTTENRFKLQGKEYLSLFGLDNYLDFGARYLDRSIGRWTIVDDLASKWHFTSPYVNTLNNSIRYIDPDGREIDVTEVYKKNKNGTYSNPNLVKAFNHFAKSKIGIAYLSQFAKGGQEVAGHIYNKSGKYHNAKIDIQYTHHKLVNPTASGETAPEIKNGRLKIDISVIVADKEKDRIDYDVETITHESFIHAQRMANDFYDNKKIDYSTGYKKYLVDYYRSKNDFRDLDHIQQSRHDKDYERQAAPIVLSYPNEYVRKNKNNYRYGY